VSLSNTIIPLVSSVIGTSCGSTAYHKDSRPKDFPEEAHGSTLFAVSVPSYGDVLMAASSSLASIGVGIDTARYGHWVSFLRPDRQPAAKRGTC
jgi:hypothetical protein